MPSNSFLPPQQPDASVGRRYAKAYKYVFAMFRVGEVVTLADTLVNANSATSIIDEGRFVVLGLPQQINLRSPFATSIRVMQDGGKVVESKGQVLRTGTISGTTGFLPPTTGVPLQSQSGQLVPNVVDIDGQLGAISGYLAFRKLSYLFDLYGDERRRGNLDVKFYFFDYKDDVFWRIEPGSFDMIRSNRKPMSYDYNIQFTCIERADPVVDGDRDRPNVLLPLPAGARISTDNVGGLLSKVAGAVGAASKSSILAAVSRFADMVTSGLNFLKFCDAVVARAFQATLNKLDAVVGFFANIHDTFFKLLGTVPTLMAQLSSSLAGLFDTIHKFAPDNIASELNAWALEVTTLSDRMAVQVASLVSSQAHRDARETDQRFSLGRMRRGAVTDLMREPGSGSPDANPFIGTSGLSLVTDVGRLTGSAQQVSVVINHGEDVYSLARRVLGRVERFIDIVILNKLEFPFIVADSARKPSNTLAWGDRVLVPAPRLATSASADGVDESASPTTSGAVSATALTDELVDTEASWIPDQWVGYSVTVTTGGIRQTLICDGNTATKLSLGGTWSIAITPGLSTYDIKYVRFDPRRPVTAETRAYGVDILAVFGTDGRCDAVIGARGDLAIVRGIDNLFQAIELRARCPLGDHQFHPTYGMAAPVGRAFTDDVAALYSFFIRRSLLGDPRVKKVRNVQLDEVGDKLMVSAEIQPVDSRASRPITVRVGT